jgi:hypothetical protein
VISKPVFIFYPFLKQNIGGRTVFLGYTSIKIATLYKEKITSVYSPFLATEVRSRKWTSKAAASRVMPSTEIAEAAKNEHPCLLLLQLLT